MKPAIEMKNWSVSYPGGDKILENCNFTLHYGEMAVLSGMSGEGKTTLLHSINGIIPHAVNAQTTGEVLGGGQPINGLKMTQISRLIGSILQNPDSQIFHSKVEDELAFGCENLNLPPDAIKQRIEKNCALLSLPMNAPTKTLSGGQKQRLMAACILAMEQKILLLDEPLANLDLAGAKLLLGVLKDLCTQGYAVLLVEHRLDIVMPYADRFFVLQDRQITQTTKEALGYANMRKIADTSLNIGQEQALVSLEHIAYHAKDTPILSDVSLTVKKGERIVLLGENGCGKTTLLRLIAGLIRPSSGRIDVQIPAKPASRSWFRSVGYVYQEPSYQLFMPSVHEEVCYGAKEDWGKHCLTAFELEALAQRHPQSLSEGQKRRVSIAAVMAGAPQLLLLDEPTVGQDYDNLEHMVHALNAMHMQTGNTMLTITHDFRCAQALADRVIWLREGKVFRSGGKELISDYFNESR